VLKELEAAVRDVGALLLRLKHENGTSGAWVGGQFKAAADTQAHAFLDKRLTALAPGIPVISEENQASHVKARPNEYWLVDPLDGTASYAHGYKGYVSQVALMAGDLPVLSVVYAPETDEMFSARTGYGAARNGEALKVRLNRRKLRLIDNYPAPQGVAALLMDKMPEIAAYVESGSLGLKICRVADGSTDIFIKNVTVKDWDIAAPLLILHEAGGHIAQFDLKPFSFSGDYNHHGVIAATDKAQAQEVKTRLTQHE
jgi:3'(2'), 5'-bisphosphate nucleotidase/myo-inositol-1(or 4)-monophosphatase